MTDAPPTREPLRDPLEVARRVTRALDRLGVRYLIGGSLASSLHGEPRSTLDIDLVVDLEVAHVSPLAAALVPEFYLDEAAVRTAVREGGAFNAIDVGSSVKVDFFIAGDDPFEQERLARRLAVRIGASGPPLHFDLAEYAILRKLEWFRRGGETSARQWRDVLAMLVVQHDRLDVPLMERWARPLGVSDLLSRVMREATGLRQSP